VLLGSYGSYLFNASGTLQREKRYIRNIVSSENDIMYFLVP
jgi:hypothetical protein